MKNLLLEKIESESFSIRECAKLLNISEKNFKEYLIEEKYIYLSPVVKKMICYDKYSTEKGNGLFYLKKDLHDGDNRILYQTKVTVIGLNYFRKKLSKEGVQNGNIKHKRIS